MTEKPVLCLSTEARISLAIARGVAASRGDDDVSPTHIALGILREEENPGVAILWRAGVALPVLRHELEAKLGPPSHPHPHESVLPTAPGEQRAIEGAEVESRQRSDPYIGTEHLLLAMLRHADTPTAQAFARHGVDYQTAVTYLEQVFSEDRGPPSPYASLAEVQAYVEANPEASLAWQMLARKHLWADNVDEAEKAYQRLIDLDPEWMANHEYDRENWERVRAAG